MIFCFVIKKVEIDFIWSWGFPDRRERFVGKTQNIIHPLEWTVTRIRSINIRVIVDAEKFIRNAKFSWSALLEGKILHF